jgi:amino acid permease
MSLIILSIFIIIAIIHGCFAGRFIIVGRDLDELTYHAGFNVFIIAFP